MSGADKATSGADHVGAAQLYRNLHRVHSQEQPARLENALKCLRAVDRLVPLAGKDIIDFGCGIGAWLAAARQLGANSVVGIEGDWITGVDTLVPSTEILLADLSTGHFPLHRRYDLALTIEVAEHLPPAAADPFCDTLVAASDLILFSAAHPGQGGVGHLNEQPLSYWVGKFKSRGYAPLDALRPTIREDRSVYSWLRANLVMFAKFELLAASPALQAAARCGGAMARSGGDSSALEQTQNLISTLQVTTGAVADSNKPHVRKATQMNKLVFVGTKQHGLYGNGKMTPSVVLPIFREVGQTFGVEVSEYRNFDEYVNSDFRGRGGALILIYNEEFLVLPDRKMRAEVERIEQIASDLGGVQLIVHASKTGVIIANKADASRTLSLHNVNTPNIVTESCTELAVFSNTGFGSGNPVVVYNPGEDIDRSRFNTELIDTLHEFAGQRYYVSLRVMAVGSLLTAVYVRASPFSENQPSVHTKNTPVDYKMLNYFYSTLVVPSMTKLYEICEKIGGVFGLGFYSHDVLPDARTGELYVCETGYKFDDAFLADHLSPIKAKLAFNDLWSFSSMVVGAHVFYRSAREMGVW